MGLDAYVRIPVITDDPDAPNSKELWYGRKENEIHGWMQEHSGIPAEDFNCERLPLTTELLDSLEETMKNKGLQETTGFFFGRGNPVDEVNQAVAELIKVSRQAIANGKEPYYFSWW